MADYMPFTAVQAREYANTAQRFQLVRELEQKGRGLRGSMAFRVSRGHEYLTRWSYGDDDTRAAKLIGRRSPETERIKAEFDAARAALKDRQAGLETALSEQAALNRAVGLGRLPEIAARILAALARAGIPRQRFRIAGTHALYAYEAMAGVILDEAHTATQDIDVLIDPRAPLRFVVGGDMEDARLLSAIRLADRSFEPTGQGFRAANRDGFLVDFLRPERATPWHAEAFEPGQGDLAPAPIAGLAWLESAPVVEPMVIDTRGRPVALPVPDPRVYAIHKWWVSRQPGRERIKARRDALQAAAVFHLVRNELPHLAFDPAHLRMLPGEVVQGALAEFEAG